MAQESKGLDKEQNGQKAVNGRRLFRGKPGGLFCFILSCWAVFAMHCRFEIFDGAFPDSALLNGLNKLYSTFSGPDFADIFACIAVYMMLRYVVGRDERIDRSSLAVSGLMALTLVACISFKKFNSAVLLFGNMFQLAVSCFCIAGFWILIYGGLRCVYHLFGNATPKEGRLERCAFLQKHFLLTGFCVILIGWLPWIILNYPGSGCPDSVLQLKEFFGDAAWGAGHPPLSSVIMGALLVLGRWIADANFGFFLYCLMQTCVGAWVFSLTMEKLRRMGVPVRWCLAGIVYFAFTPLWGAFAQWMEKDFFYAQIAVLQTVCMMDILVKKECGRKDTVFLVCTSLGAVFLRNNGIYAVLPALVLLAVWLRGTARRRVIAAALITLLSYEAAMKVLYPALGIQGLSPVEALSIPFQQTARYVCEHSEELTEHEREIIDTVFGYDSMFGYDPVISDPIKNHCRNVEMGEYLKTWFQMFFKHPGTYVAAFLNKGFGYLAPVSQNIEAWIQLEYYEYMEEIGLHRMFSVLDSHILVQVWSVSMALPLLKYLTSPGLYTWIGIVLALMLVKRRRYGTLILFVPSLMNVLVCLASPLAESMRYELPTVASMPLLIGWAYLSIRGEAK